MGVTLMIRVKMDQSEINSVYPMAGKLIKKPALIEIKSITT